MDGPTPSDTSADRAALRDQLLERMGGPYDPWLHLAIPSLVGGAIAVACVALLRDLRAWQLVTLPLAFVVLNAGEWRIHRTLLHHRTRPFELLYDRHTPEHHRVFVDGDMAIRSSREFRLVLIPAYGIFGALVGGLPIPALLWLLGQRNAGLLFLAVAIGYTVLYEWLHLAYHLPPDGLVGSRRLIARLRRHHETHHDPRLMQRWNFNVTVPLWDWVRGTIHRPPATERARSISRQ